ncbi:MAG: FAD binding domain-containing protein [Chloroflexi bacterium]|nr:FAD binding domain-containing protein [Chloroflexota bacterium]MBU1751799.1 FAD binding domain-containing protein [Chloroflexota bacterium]
MNLEAYLFPSSVDEALDMLNEHRGHSQIIAGGTDLVLQARSGKSQATVLVDITRIPGLDAIAERDGYIVLGAQVTHAQAMRSLLIQQRAGVLAQACSTVGGPQIRNVGTLVGNVVNALPAADSAVALFALDAELEIVDADGRQWQPIASLYQGVGLCSLDRCGQVVTAIRFRPLPDDAGSAFERLAKRRALTLPVLNAAAVVDLDDGRFRQTRIAVGPVASTPFRATAAEEALAGQPATPEAIAQAAQLAARDAQPRDSLLRGGKEYRTDMVKVLVRRALTRAAKQEVL